MVPKNWNKKHKCLQIMKYNIRDRVESISIKHNKYSREKDVKDNVRNRPKTVNMSLQVKTKTLFCLI